MRLQTLVSAVRQEVGLLAEKMNLQSDAIIINQCDENSYLEYEWKGHKIKAYSFQERGVGLSRNNALLRADSEILLFSDEDIVYDDGYKEKILQAFRERPKADMLLFNVEVEEGRATYHIDKEHRVRFYNSGRYPTYSFAVRREKLHSANITFSLLFGGGARYSNGEDSLFLMECLKKGFRIYALPIAIGKEIPRPSTWFFGYNEKFFFDRGVLYHYLYGKLKYVMSLRFLLAHRKKMCGEIKEKEAFRLMLQGIKEAKENN
ncbi:MAG: glycosyltransferase family 2 protein [Lachnospiraceae bacterium]|nr:glycosyltransferase family 2 protein [Lachnospiraceae bacterium]